MRKKLFLLLISISLLYLLHSLICSALCSRVSQTSTSASCGESIFLSWFATWSSNLPIPWKIGLRQALSVLRTRCAIPFAPMFLKTSLRPFILPSLHNIRTTFTPCSNDEITSCPSWFTKCFTPLMA